VLGQLSYPGLGEGADREGQADGKNDCGAKHDSERTSMPDLINHSAMIRKLIVTSRDTNKL
jgi:hypothetical protein